MFTLTEQTIDCGARAEALRDPGAGALVTFEGWIRNVNEGKAVTSLEYEAYVNLAEREGQTILDEAKQHFPILRAACVHRTGHLAIADVAVWVGVACAHRDAAYKANRFIIDEVKRRLPIWKREHYADGSADWVRCQECARHVNPLAS
ncbi:MAG: molybdopterin synthase catalytic subunit [Candidatus Promineifilaceae bacterium]|jgi:molybdopterin synthase catalytic subunit